MRSAISAEGVCPSRGPSATTCLCTSAEHKRRARSASVLTQFSSMKVASSRGDSCSRGAETEPASRARRIRAMMTAWGSHPVTEPAPITRKLAVVLSLRSEASASGPSLFSFTNMVVSSVPSSTGTAPAKAFSFTRLSRATESSWRSAMLELPPVPPPTRSSFGHVSPRALRHAVMTPCTPPLTLRGRMSSGKHRIRASANLRCSGSSSPSGGASASRGGGGGLPKTAALDTAAPKGAALAGASIIAM
mmetsp:Transcript_70717/g.218699  ORF Transcript_70717/g.218699 Transcript_70717/m.218699 type:complete len:248 (+) Transcript_70717:211-954(+)